MREVIICPKNGGDQILGNTVVIIYCADHILGNDLLEKHEGWVPLFL